MKITVVGLSELRAKLAELRGRAADLHPALLRAGIEVVNRAQVRIRSGGDPPWKPTKYPSNLHPPLIKKGTLFRSFSDGDAVTDISGGVRAGTNIFYAPYQQDGTRGRPSRVARLMGARSIRRDREHGGGGIPPRPFLYIDESLADQVRATIANWIAKGE